MSVTYVSKKGLKDNRKNSIDIPNYTGIFIGGGGFSQVFSGGSVIFRITRLTSDDNYDETFAIYVSNSTVIGFGSTAYFPIIQPDGKIMVATLSSTYQGFSSNRMTRINSNGTLDSTFTTGSGFVLSGGSQPVRTIAIQSDGKYIVGGNFISYRGVSYNNIIRLNSDGSIDNSFSIGTGFNLSVQTIKIQSDGKILIGGNFTAYNGTTSNRIIRLNTDGSIDNTFNVGTGFGTGTGFYNTISKIILQSDGKPIIVGDYSTYQGQTRNRIIRLNTDGSIDTTFNIGTGFNVGVIDAILQSDGKIIVGGDFTSYQGQTRNRIIRLNTDGSIDTTFNIGTGFNDDVLTLELQSDGKILVGGLFTQHNGFNRPYLVKLNTDGTFYNNPLLNSSVSGIAVQPDDNYVLTGDFSAFYGNTNIRTIPILVSRIAAKRLDNQLSDIEKYNIVLYQNAVGLSNGFNDVVNVIKVQMDRTILIGGSFTSYHNITANGFIKLDITGAIDNTFNLGTGFNSSVSAIEIQNDNKIIIAGFFTTYQGQTRNRLVRLNVDGSIDDTFNIGTGFGSGLRTIAMQSNSKIIAGGDFTNYQGQTRNRIIRLNTDGSIDNTFNIGTGFSSRPRTIAIQSDGKIIIGGDFTSYQGQTRNRIIRLNTDGSIDSTFNIGIGFNDNVFTISIQSDGKILIGGNFTTYQEQTRNRLVRLNVDGSIDDTFNIGTGFNSIIHCIQLNTDKQIYAAGEFTFYQNLQRNRLVKINSDGSIDSNFKLGASGIINTLALY
jgi:uncharacterized delta-60 repeat protein